MADLFDEAVDWLQIPSISAGARDEARCGTPPSGRPSGYV